MISRKDAILLFKEKRFVPGLVFEHRSPSVYAGTPPPTPPCYLTESILTKSGSCSANYSWVVSVLPILLNAYNGNILKGFYWKYIFNCSLKIVKHYNANQEMQNISIIVLKNISIQWLPNEKKLKRGKILPKKKKQTKKKTKRSQMKGTNKPQISFSITRR